MLENEKEFKLTKKLFLRWPLFVEIGFCLLTILMLIFKNEYWWILLIGLATNTLLFIYLVTKAKSDISRELLGFASDYSNIQNRLIYEMNIPYAIMDKEGKVLWMNKQMCKVTGEDVDFNKNIAGLFKCITPNIFPKEDEKKSLRFTFNDRDYRAELKKSSFFVALYLFDETKINTFRKKLVDDAFAVALIEVDNYEDVIEKIDDLSQSYIAGLVEKKINDYFSNGGAFIRKLEKDRYIAVFRYKELEKYAEDRFSILEDIKGIVLENGMTITLSIGVGTGEEDYAKCYDLSKNSLELALGRGGDQAVVRDLEIIRYYGGRSQQMERNTRVKVRVKAQALKQVLEAASNIIIMGHKLPDIDAFGAAIGMFCFAKYLGKEAHIVINELSTSVKPFYDRFLTRDEYKNGVFISSEEAIRMTDKKTTVIVVDVNKTSLADCPEVVEAADQRVVFDHHRTSAEPISKVVLSYVDSFASSTCEMVTEMIQFASLNMTLKGFEADAIYAGIAIDTNNFTAKSGPRTFEAAAYLRRNGADVIRVRKLLRSDMSEYISVAKAVSTAEVYKGAFAITEYEDNSITPTIGCAKTANELLDIVGIKAAFSITEYNSKIYVSARSIDEVNVQLVMERLGGGGHLNIAGAQLVDVDKDTAKELIKETLDKMIEEGEL